MLQSCKLWKYAILIMVVQVWLDIRKKIVQFKIVKLTEAAPTYTCTPKLKRLRSSLMYCYDKFWLFFYICTYTILLLPEHPRKAKWIIWIHVYISSSLNNFACYPKSEIAFSLHILADILNVPTICVKKFII